MTRTPGDADREGGDRGDRRVLLLLLALVVVAAVAVVWRASSESLPVFTAEPGRVAEDVRQDAGGGATVDGPAFQSDQELTDDGLPGGTPTPRVDEATGLRIDHLVVAVDRGMLVFMDPSGSEGSVRVDPDTEYRQVAVRPGSSAEDLVVVVVAERADGTFALEVLRVGGGTLQGAPGQVAAIEGEPSGLVWADDGSAVAWTLAGVLAAAPVGPDGTPGPSVELGPVDGWVADWNRQDQGDGELTFAVPREGGGLGSELRTVQRTDDGFELGPVTGSQDVLVLHADATDASGEPARWVIDQTAEEVSLSIASRPEAPIATVPVSSPPQGYAVGGGMAIVVTDMGTNDGIMRVTADGEVTEIALWRAYDVLD